VRLGRLLSLVASNLRSAWVRAALAMVGIVVGTGLLTFFLGLGQGLREKVLERIFPVNQLELEPRAVQIFGTEQILGQEPLDDARVRQVAGLPGVVRAFGKQKSSFPARLWGGKELLGYNLFTEAFFDGMPAAVLRAELEELEGAAAKRGVTAGAHSDRCEVDLDCAAGLGCSDGVCVPIVWADRFVEMPEVVLPCSVGDRCPQGMNCQQSRCALAAEASPPVRCVLPAAAGNGRDLQFDREVGERAAPCGDPLGYCGAAGTTCGEGRYCAADHPETRLGWCERPLPAVINPLLLEVFNSDMARSLGAAPIGSLAVLFGVRFHVALGDSYFSKDAEKQRQQFKQAIVVGFSRKAPELGVALPRELVRHFNARLKGRAAADAYDAILIDTASNQDVPQVIVEAEKLGLQLSRKSRAARTFGTVVLVTSLALVLLAAVVLAVAAVQIAQTFAMLVHERRREIAVLRALGAARLDIAVLVLGEAAAIGLLGGACGGGAAVGAAALVDHLAAQWLADVPLLPQGFFAFPAWAVPLAIGVAVAFTIAGALAPARRAMRLDPAAVLAEG